MLENKNILITGASRGIGRAIALEAARYGARVGINYYQSKKQAHALAQQIQTAGLASPLLLRFDATRPLEIQEGLESFLNAFGQIDGWVNNAATHNPGLLPVLSEEEIRRQIDSALLGPVFCCRTVIPCMLQNKKGSIVNIGSTVTEKAFRGQAVYASAKGGIVSLTRALAFEYARKGVRVNCVQPGPSETDMLAATINLAGDEILKQIPQGRYCPPQEIAALVVFLLSDSSASITGACINIDGGYTLQ